MLFFDTEKPMANCTSNIKFVIEKNPRRCCKQPMTEPDIIKILAKQDLSICGTHSRTIRKNYHGNDYHGNRIPRMW